MNKLEIGFPLTMLLFVIMIMAGWVMNVVHLIELEELVLNGENVLRIIGVFIAPIGSILGWFC